MDKEGKEAIGTIAGILTTGSFIPQVYSVWSHAPQPATDVSLGMFSLMSLGVMLWFIYGCCLRSQPLIVFNATTFILSMSVLTYKLIYG